MGLLPFPKQNNDDDAMLFQLKLNDMLLTQRKNGWIEIMDFIYEELPFLKKHHRPKTEDIKNSFIGALGYTSWQAYLETGLHWSEEKWRSWHKAYSRVDENAYLRNCDVSRNAINDAHKELKENFPSDHTAWIEYQERKKLRKAGSNKPMHEGDEPDYLMTQLCTLEHEYHLEKQKIVKLKTRCLNIYNKLSAEQFKTIENKTYIAGLETENSGYKYDISMLLKSEQENQKIITELKSSLSEKENEIVSTREEVLERDDEIALLKKDVLRSDKAFWTFLVVFLSCDLFFNLIKLN